MSEQPLITIKVCNTIVTCEVYVLHACDLLFKFESTCLTVRVHPAKTMFLLCGYLCYTQSLQ